MRDKPHLLQKPQRSPREALCPGSKSTTTKVFNAGAVHDLTLQGFDYRLHTCCFASSSASATVWQFAAQGAARNRRDLAGELTESLGSQTGLLVMSELRHSEISWQLKHTALSGRRMRAPRFPLRGAAPADSDNDGHEPYDQRKACLEGIRQTY